MQIHLCLAYRLFRRAIDTKARALDPVKVLGRDIAGDVLAVETGGLETPQVRAQVTDRLLHRLDVLVDQRIRTNGTTDLVIAAPAGDQLGTRGHIDAVHIRVAHRGGGRGEVDLVGTRLARHLHDLMRRGPTHDGIIHQQHVFAAKLDAHRIELLTHGFSAHRLPRHDEGAPHIAVLDEPLAIVQVQSIRQLQRRGA